MSPESKQPRNPEYTTDSLQLQPEHDFIIPEVLTEYKRRLPDFVGQFTDAQLIGRANNVRFETPLRTWEDGYVSHRVVEGMFEPHIRSLITTPTFLARRSEMFNKLVADGVDPRTAEVQATQSIQLMAIPMVEKVHDPVVQEQIRKEFLRRADVAVVSADAIYERFKSAIVSEYHATDVQHPWEVAKVLFTRYQAPGKRIHPVVKDRHFDLLATLGTSTPDTRPFIADIDGTAVSTTLQEAKMRLVFGLHAREVQAGLRLGKKLDVVRIREKFEPLYEKLGYPYQDPQQQLLPSRLREGAIVTSLALRAGGQVVGQGVDTVARVTAKNAQAATRVGSAGILSVGLLAPLAQGPTTAERPATSVSQLAASNTLPAIDLNAKNMAFSALPTLEASVSVRAGEKCASPFVYTDNMKEAVARIKAKGGKWKDEAIILDFFLEKCMGINASSGIVGNAEEESGSNPKQRQIGGPARYDFMWEAGRLERLLKRKDPETHKTQLNFAWQEMNEGDMVDDLRKAKSPEHGAEVFERLFERAGVPHMDVRKGHARDLYNEFLKEYKIVESSSYAAHNTPKAPAAHAGHATTPAATQAIDFAKAIGENFASSEPAINSLNQLDVKEQDASVAAKAQALTSGIESTLAASADAEAPTLNVEPAVDQQPLAGKTDNTPHVAPIQTHDLTAAIASAIATREASAVPAALSLDAAPDPSAASAPAPSSINIQAALAAQPVAPAEQAPLPSASSVLEALPPVSLPSEATTPPPAVLAQTTPPPSSTSPTPLATTPLPTTTTPAPAESSAAPLASSPAASASLLPTTAPEATPSQATPSEASLADATAPEATTTATPDSSNQVGDASSLADAAPAAQQPSAQQPTTPASPILPPIAPAPVEKKADAPRAETPEAQSTVEQKRQAEIARLKDSGDFKKSQALDNAQRSPLEKKLESQGQQNGRLKDVERLGSRWGDASLYAPAAEQFRKMDAAYYKEFGKHIAINDSYRSYARQVATKADAVSKGRPQFAATPGHSKHGWGLALDLGGGMQSFNSKEYKWMLKHALDFGFNHPDFADDSSSPEPWHWEYVLSE